MIPGALRLRERIYAKTPTIARGFQQLSIGAGGWLTGLDVASDGTRLARSDTNGLYLYDGSRWNNLLTHDNTPTSIVNANTALLPGSGGVYDAVICPSNLNRIYILYRGYALRSDDKGVSWTVLSNFTRDSNWTQYAEGGQGRLASQKMAVDPINADHIIAGTTTGGVFRSIDAGVTWTKLSTIVTASGNIDNPGYAGIVFDPNSTVTSGRSNTIYIGCNGTGVYQTTNGGTATPTWTQISGSGHGGGPTKIVKGQIDPTTNVTYGGSYYCTELVPGVDWHGWRYHGGTWTDLGAGIYCIAPHPVTAGRVAMFKSQNAQDALVSSTGGTSPIAVNGQGIRVASDIPWLATTKEAYMSLGDAKFDPSSSGGNTLCISEGIGWWEAVFPITNTSYNWTSRSLGLEQLVPGCICSPPGGNPIFGVSDRSAFYNPNTTTYPSHQLPNTAANPSGDAMSLADTKSIEYCAGTPTFLVMLTNTLANENSAFSTDGGLTWQNFASVPLSDGVSLPAPPFTNQPNNRAGGTLAINCNDPTNIVWMQGNNGLIRRTLNGGASWASTTPPGGATTVTTTGYGFATYLARHGLAADEVLADTFYGYCDSSGPIPGIFKSTDKAASWTMVHIGAIAGNDAFHIKLRAVPRNAGHLFWCEGNNGGNGLFKSTDGGATWAKPNANISFVNDFAFGKARSGGYPAIYLWGALSGVYGFYRSEDAGVTWNLLQASPWALASVNNQLQWIIGADMNTFGLFYVGMAEGAGFARGYFPT